MKKLEHLQSDLSSVLKELSSLNTSITLDCVKDTLGLENIKVTQIAQDQYWLNSSILVMFNLYFPIENY